MGRRSPSRSPPRRRSPSPVRDRHGDRERRRSPSLDRNRRASPSYKPYRGHEEHDYALRADVRGGGMNRGGHEGGYRGDRNGRPGAYGRTRPDERLPSSFGRSANSASSSVDSWALVACLLPPKVDFGVKKNKYFAGVAVGVKVT